jgi:Na+-translocating ferredoxin:NAD+ oxidoreductase RnfD subunit
VQPTNEPVAGDDVTSPTLTLGGSTYPVILPNIRDPRLNVAAVIITIHVLGQVGLRFQVSVPQILAAILTCAVLEVALTFRRSRSFVWPASAMLTGSGVALILRVPDTPVDDTWTTHRWYVFAGVAGASLLTKYVIRYRGSHVFNPSNIGLVAVFVLLGSRRVEPLDFWWAPLNGWMIAAYAVIVVGGLLITGRLRLLAVAATYWLALAAGVGLLAASGHCMTARWAFAPVCGFDYWRVIVTSPEVLIFLFFMITDPKTVPAGRVGRVVFGLLVALASTLLMAPQTDEFGTKVALLGGLVVVCAGRPLLDRLVPVPGSAADDLGRFATGLMTGRRRGAWIRPKTLQGGVRIVMIGAAVFIIGVGVVIAGAPARGVVVPGADDVLGRVPHDVDPATFPTISVEQGVVDWNHEIAGPGAQAIVLTLAENLELENQALLRADGAILTAVDHGDRLDDMRARLDEAAATGTTALERYQIDSVHVTLLVPFGRQDGLSLGLESRGTLTNETYDAAGGLQARVSSPFATTFVLRQATGGRWLNVDVLPLGTTR